MPCPRPRPRHIRKALKNLSTDDFLSSLLSSSSYADRCLTASFRQFPKTLDSLSLPSNQNPNPNRNLDPTSSFFNTTTSALIASHGLSEPNTSFALLKQHAGIRLSNASYSILLKLQFLLESDSQSVFAIIGSMVKSGCKPDVVTYSTLISGLCRVGRIKEAWGVLDKMLKNDCAPSVRCFTSIVLGYCKEGRIEEAKELVERLRSFGCEPDAVICTILIDGLCKRGEFDEVEKILRGSGLKGWVPDEITYNVYLNALCRTGEVDEACRQLDIMEEQGLSPTMETLHILFSRLCRDSNYVSLWRDELLYDWDADTFFYNTLMSRLCRLGRWIAVCKLWACMLKRGLETIATYTTIIRNLCKKKMLEEAKYVFYNVGMRADLVAFNTLLLGFNMDNKFIEVYQLLSYMARENVAPNEFTYSIMIDSLCREKRFIEAVHCFVDSIRNGFNAYLITRPIRWLVKDGKRREILNLFEEMLRRGFVLDGFIFDSLVRGFCNEGLCRGAESDLFYLIFDKMLGIR